LLRSAKPIVMAMTPWIARRDARQLREGREGVEQTIRAEAARELGRHA